MSSCDDRLLAALTALKNGDLSVRLPDKETGTAGEIAITFNAFMDQMNIIVKELNRISREIGTDGRLGGQAQVSGLNGAWSDLVNNVNGMEMSLTENLRTIACMTNLLMNSRWLKPLPPQRPAHAQENEIAWLRNDVARLAYQVSKEFEASVSP